MKIIRTLYFAPALFWAGFLCWVSAASSSELPKLSLFQADKIGHLGVYALFTWLLLWGWRGLTRSPASTLEMVWAAACFSTAFGVAMEIMQGGFVPGRFFDQYDMIANGFGAFCAAWVWKWRVESEE